MGLRSSTLGSMDRQRAPPEQPNVRIKKEEMVLQLVFRKPTETLHATTAPVCPPPFSLPKSTQSMCCTTVRRLAGYKRGRSIFPRVHAALVRLVGSSSPKGAAWGQLSKPWARGSVCRFRRATLSQRDTYRASLMGDQATMKRRLGAVDGRRSVDSNAGRRLQS
jgi:hypothetical protein